MNAAIRSFHLMRAIDQSRSLRSGTMDVRILTRLPHGVSTCTSSKAPRPVRGEILSGNPASHLSGNQQAMTIFMCGSDATVTLHFKTMPRD